MPKLVAKKMKRKLQSAIIDWEAETKEKNRSKSKYKDRNN